MTNKIKRVKKETPQEIEGKTIKSCSREMKLQRVKRLKSGLQALRNTDSSLKVKDLNPAGDNEEDIFFQEVIKVVCRCRQIEIE